MKTKTTFFLLLLFTTIALAQEVEVYDDFEAFEQSIENNCVNTELTFEDFSGILETNCAVPLIPDPDQECFAIDELEDGFTFQGRNPEGNSVDIIAGQQGEFGDSPINFVTPNNIFGTAVIDFDPPVDAVAFSLWGFLNNTGSTEVTLFDDNEEIIEIFNLDTPNGELYFFSAVSSTPISRVITTNPDPGEAEGQTGGGGSLIGQLYFGASDCTILSVNNAILKQISLAPNPARDIINIKTPNNLSVKNATLTNVIGQVSTLDLNQGQVNIAEYKSGVYFLTISTDNGSVTKKLIIN